MRKPNVFLEDTGVTHARATGVRTVTRCGVEYDRLRAPLFDPRSPGVETGDDVNCMTCLVKCEASDADLRQRATFHWVP